MILFKLIKNIDSFLGYLFSQIFSLFLILIFIPIFIFISILILFIDGKPIIYNSVRSGFLGKQFKLYKFRTMSEGKLRDDLRITKLGKILRRSSLDELPQLFNILKGEMVFVGPRPLPFETVYDNKYKRFFLKRSSVKPGLTGLSQAFSKGLPRKYSEKLVYDLMYIKKKSILFDLMIILMTFIALRRRFLFNKSGKSL